jgi:YHS domain-containing protein
LPNLARLHLERTAVTDAGLPAVLPLRNLEYLNLHSTAVTDEGVTRLGESPSLRQLYVWQTKVTPVGAQAFTSARVDETQIRQWEEEIENLRRRISEQQVIINLGTTNQPQTAKTSAAKPELNANCPVSGEPVDSTKTSVYEGKTVAFCCDKCKAKFDADPKPFLAKLPSTK